MTFDPEAASYAPLQRYVHTQHDFHPPSNVGLKYMTEQNEEKDCDEERKRNAHGYDDVRCNRWLKMPLYEHSGTDLQRDSKRCVHSCAKIKKDEDADGAYEEK